MAATFGFHEVNTGSTDLNHLNGTLWKESSSFGDYSASAPKVRKHYTITKQRERWTEEEHKKFVEALQLYGRCWRRIKEHIGTKTAVQIRSHAQKFFSKVARDASCAGSVKAIEIPPPRPKRKPIRPYPRKQAPCSSKELPVLKPFGRSSSPVPSASEQENRSPTSVLSAIGFETMNPFLSNKPKKSTSPSASAAGSNEPGIGIQSSAMSVLSLGLPGQKTEGSSQTVHKLELEQFNLLPEPALDTNSFFQERSHSSTQTLKLFGATVQVTGDRTSPLPLEGATRQCQGLDFEEGSKAGFAMGAWPSSGLLPMFFCLPSPTNSALPAAEAGIVPTPCWTLYGNAPFPYAVPQQNSTSKEKFNQSCVQNECSGTGSNTSYEGGNVFNYQQGDRCSDEKESAAPMALKLWQNMTADSNSGRGFVPYKRCVVEERVEHPERTGDQARDRRTARLCL